MTMHLGEATIGTGSTGDEVKRIQQILQGQGYNVGPLDGIYGSQTQTAVSAFQRVKGLIPDGIVGPLTWAALQGTPPAPATLPEKMIVRAPSSGMGSLGILAIVGIAGVVFLSMIGQKR